MNAILSTAKEKIIASNISNDSMRAVKAKNNKKKKTITITILMQISSYCLEKIISFHNNSLKPFLRLWPTDDGFSFEKIFFLFSFEFL